MKNADQPIAPIIFRQTGENEHKIASEKDIREGVYLSSYNGLTKREYFAGNILCSIISNREMFLTIISNRREEMPNEYISKQAIEIAESLLSELEKTKL